MTQQTISIDKNETITICNNTFGDITITLNNIGEYVIVSNGPPVAMQQTSIDGNFKQQYTGNGKYFEQTVLKGVKIKDDLILSNVSQSIG